MMNGYFRIAGYIRYLGKAHGPFGVHSPFVYDFYTKVVKAPREHRVEFDAIEALRKSLEKDKSLVEVDDKGTGKTGRPALRSVSHIASVYAGRSRDAVLLVRMVEYFNLGKVLELGTSLGLTTLYLASARNQPECITIEGCGRTLAIAGQNFRDLGKNIRTVHGDFADVLPGVLKQAGFPAGLIYFDGNHDKEATLGYFKLCLEYADEDSVFVFDDIHWSRGMQEAWEEIAADKRVSVSIDLYHLGIVFFRKKIRKQHFILRY